MGISLLFKLAWHLPQLNHLENLWLLQNYMEKMHDLLIDGSQPNVVVKNLGNLWESLSPGQWLLDAWFGQITEHFKRFSSSLTFW